MQTHSLTKYPKIRNSLSGDYAEMADQHIEALLESHGINAESMEGFFSDLGKIASSAGATLLKAAPSILPVAGTVLGTAFGGPLGASLGGKLGSLAGGAISSATARHAPSLGSPSAARLLKTVLNPGTIQALTSMALGPVGNPSFSVAGKSIPVGAFNNLLGVLSGKAEAEYNAAMAGARESTPAYMQDYAGEAKGDPAVPEHRAEALYELLEWESEQEWRESSETAYESEMEAYESEMEAIEAEYEALELTEDEDGELYYSELYDWEED